LESLMPGALRPAVLHRHGLLGLQRRLFPERLQLLAPPRQAVLRLRRKQVDSLLDGHPKGPPRREQLLAQLGQRISRRRFRGRLEPAVAQLLFHGETIGLAQLAVVDAQLGDVAIKTGAAAGAWPTEPERPDGRIAGNAVDSLAGASEFAIAV